MKKTLAISLLALAALGSCKKDFLEEKRDLTGMNEEVYKDPLMAKAYTGYIYGLFQPADNAAAMTVYQTNNNGAFSDLYTKTTDEMAGQTDLNREWPLIAINQTHALQYFGQPMSSSIANNVWTRMRQINLFLDEIDKHGLAAEVTAPLKGEMYFWRAYQYFELLKLYGGVPLILTAQNPSPPDGDNSNQVQRSSSAATVAQIEADLDLAASLLPGRRPDVDWGRLTSGAALALKGRVLLTWASPLFNRNDERARWQKAYDANLAAKTRLEANGFGLYTNGGTANAQAWENMWTHAVNNPEGVFIVGFNSIQTENVKRNNGHEQAARSKQILGAGSISPTKQVVDAFPMKDGKLPGDPTSAYTYDAKKFYKNRDPRFYKTFAYNGSLWPYSGAANFRQWTYYWSTTATAATPNKSTEVAGANGTGIYLRKATNPNASNAPGTFAFSGTDYMDLRFAEVILNLAESAIGADKLGEGLTNIGLVRQRAGIENLDGAYGLNAAAGNRDRLFEAVINERKVEFAYENKRFWDLRRWLLFNNDFGTCTRLNQKPIQGTRRTGYWVYVKNTNGTKYVGNDDPLMRRTNGTIPIVEREPGTFPPGVSNMEQYVDYLYDNHFEILERDNVDPTNPVNWKFTWYNQYYFFGLHQAILGASPYLQQTKLWPDLNGAQGTFDPLQ
ncbi:RagB/SusD family nutrient uptake outer membrane protein [Terrimonas sp. NA20]|uniref:RagB/SusD family nutrient uptake outer membrane protein n=1 Tax=Terrimonas ginsenosidimutans TaxID=2908004 RepID=A0ABS9KR52_9BACT|nr:RagB/SusD family nutrient uptake outer membrane protein [Terrimonas ginsenosidimutans]MCG2614812.1 RagB/SusD family nutrient uptake outer membrane protein [Terrimonas ginsenosidimutans]